MKKSIVYLGLVLATFTNVALASETGMSQKTFISSTIATPLGVAISKGELDVVKKFVEYGADVNEKSNGLTPLMLAARYNNVEILKFLISKGALVNVKTENGLTALKYAELSNAKDAVAFLKAEK